MVDRYRNKRLLNIMLLHLPDTLTCKNDHWCMRSVKLKRESDCRIKITWEKSIVLLIEHSCLNFHSTNYSFCKTCQLFHELRRYHTRPLQLNCGPVNVHFGKKPFWDLIINVRVPKNSPKNSPMFKIRRKMTKTTFPLGGDSI